MLDAVGKRKVKDRQAQAHQQLLARGHEAAPPLLHPGVQRRRRGDCRAAVRCEHLPERRRGVGLRQGELGGVEADGEGQAPAVRRRGGRKVGVVSSASCHSACRGRLRQKQRRQDQGRRRESLFAGAPHVRGGLDEAQRHPHGLREPHPDDERGERDAAPDEQREQEPVRERPAGLEGAGGLR